MTDVLKKNVVDLLVLK
jgi:hypothetical protein